MFCGMFLPEIQTWDGFWALVIFDSNTKDVIAFTDPLGRKPLYYNNLGEISSEVKSLVSLNSEIDLTTMSTIRKWGYNTDERTSYSEVKRFLPNNIYSFNLISPEFKNVYPSYFKGFEHPIYELEGGSYEDHMEWLWTKMFESVRNRLISKDYPISLLVSGGLDSSIIAAILKETGSDVRWFTIDNNEDQQWTSNLTTSAWSTRNYNGSSYVDASVRTVCHGDLA